MTTRIVLSVVATLALGAGSGLMAQDRTRYDALVAEPPMVRMDLDQGSRYSWGQPVRVRFSTDRDAFVMIASVSQDGQLKVLYPETPSDQAAVFGGTDYVVTGRPWSGVAGASRRGTYGYVFAIASDQPIELSRFAARSGRTWKTTYFQFARYGAARPEAERMIDQVADEILFDRQITYGYDLRYFLVEGAHFYSTSSCWGLYCSRYDDAWSSYCSSFLFGFAFDIGVTPWECLYQPRYRQQRLAYNRPRYPNPPGTPENPRDGMPVPPVSGLKPDTVHWIVPDSSPQAPTNRTQPPTKPTITIVAQDAPDTAGLGESRRMRDSDLDGRVAGTPLNRRGVRPELVARESPLEPVTGLNADATPPVYRPSPVERGRPHVLRVEPTEPDDARARDNARTLRPERADDGSTAGTRSERAQPPTVIRPELERPEPARRDESRAEPTERERPTRAAPIERRTEEPPRIERPRQEPPRVERPRQEPVRVERPKQEPPRVERPRQEPTRVERPRQEPRRVEQPRREPTRVERPRREPARVERPRQQPRRVEQPRREPTRVERPRVERSAPPPRRTEPPPTRKP